jgi:hypothetical protein
MKQCAAYSLALLAFFWFWLALMGARAQVLAGTFAGDLAHSLACLPPLPVRAAAGGAAFGLASNPTRATTTALGLPAGTTLPVYSGRRRLARTAVGSVLATAGLPAQAAR